MSTKLKIMQNPLSLTAFKILEESESEYSAYIIDSQILDNDLVQQANDYYRSSEQNEPLTIALQEPLFHN